MNDVFRLIDKLASEHSLTIEEYEALIEARSHDTSTYLTEKAVSARKAVYGNKVFIRGLIEISNICKNDCFYCGIRRSNKNCDRYRLTADEIVECCVEGYSLGFRTFVLQGGEDAYFTDEILCDIIRRIKQKCEGCAVTLSLGERDDESYRKLYIAGADRYLLRHETATESHYRKLHPDSMSFTKRMKCLDMLKKIGFQVGCGFMVGSPFQNVSDIARDLKFIEEFSPDMCGIGPFIPHKNTDFAGYLSGSAELTCYLLSIIRLIKPNILLPATTALGTVNSDGRENGIKSGANVIMPNLSPKSVRRKYMLYDNKLSDGDESAQNLTNLKTKMLNIGYEIVTDRGDIIK
ncbi:MAG: [FeFe] hydrogenase H-cluster radical SAM maturase HydE [Clostridia bacterium]|nr:[FeFe] hydrogenase H-cluster radical SAM maturase HydE [Clostridia bacterium]